MGIRVDVLTARGAANRLRVTPEELVALLEAHLLIGEQLPDGQWLVSTDSLRAYRQQTADTGRPWSTATAWAALAELDGLPTANLSSGTAHQLRQRLHTISPQTLARKLGRRGVIHPYVSTDPAQLASAIIPTGPSAVSDDSSRRSPLPGILHGYLADQGTSIEDFATRYALLRRIEGNVHLYDRPDWVPPEYIGPATIAADQANNDLDDHRQAGLVALADIQDRWIATQRPSRRRR